MWGRVAFLAAAVALVGGGCAEKQEAPPRPSAKAKRFHARALAFHRLGQSICLDYGREMKLSVRLLRLGETSAGAHQLLTASEQLRRRLARLEPPTSDGRRQLRRLIAVMRVEEVASRRMVARIDQGVELQRAIAPEYRGSRRRGRQADRVLRRLGLPACSTEELENWARLGL